MMAQKPSPSKGRVLVIGAGIVGTCCALWLRQLGFAVTLVDRDVPGSGCSAGNAGIMHSGSVLPLLTMSILRRLPQMLLDPEGPLVVRWRYLPSLAPWLARLAGYARPAEVARISNALSGLLRGALDATRALAAEAGAGHLLCNEGELYVIQGRAAQVLAAKNVSFYRSRGVQVVELRAAELRERVPVLSEAYRHGYYLPQSAFTIDPRAFTQALAASFVAQGGNLERREITDIQRAEGGTVVAKSSEGAFAIDHLVIAAGAFSRGLAERTGVHVPLASLRGYHLELPARGAELSGPLIDAGMNFGVVPMAGGIRLAGLVELAGLEAPPDWRRADMLLPLARRMLPTLDGSQAVRWMGHRPGLPDSMPMLGPVPGWRNVWFCFGHGQLGLTTAAISGKSLAQAIAGLEPGMDLSPFRVERFSGVGKLGR
jgi:D-amino-acid dehydrogenase